MNRSSAAYAGDANDTQPEIMLAAYDTFDTATQRGATLNENRCGRGVRVPADPPRPGAGLVPDTFAVIALAYAPGERRAGGLPTLRVSGAPGP